MKGHPLIHLMAAGIVAMTVSGCAVPIRESKTPLESYSRFYVAWLSETQPALVIKDIQQVGEPSTRFTPSPPVIPLPYPFDTRLWLWLRPGTYEATVECLRPQDDAYSIPTLKTASPPDPDGKIRFTIEYHGVVLSRLSDLYNSYEMDCATAPDGKPEFVVNAMKDADFTD